MYVCSLHNLEHYDLYNSLNLDIFMNCSKSLGINLKSFGATLNHLNYFKDNVSRQSFRNYNIFLKKFEHFFHNMSEWKLWDIKTLKTETVKKYTKK